MDHTSIAQIKYDPYRGGLKRNKRWWIVANVDREITRYYRWWIESQLHVKGMCQPSYDAHISILRGEKPADDLLHLWKKYDNTRIEFQYEHNPYHIPATTTDGGYWAVRVSCKEMTDIRSELNRPTQWGLHLTVGRTWF